MSIIAPGVFWPERMGLTPFTTPQSLRWRNRGMGWTSSRPRVRLGEAVGGISVPSGNVPTTSALLYWLARASRKAEREGGLSPKSPRPGRGGNTQTPALGQAPPRCFAALICQIFPPLWHVVPLVSLPRGQITLPQLYMTSDHRFLQKGSQRGSKPSFYR